MSRPERQGAAAEVENVLAMLDQITELAAKADDFSVAKEMFDLTNLRLFLRFQPQAQAKRIINKISGGVVTFGAAEPPIDIYSARQPASVSGISRNRTTAIR